MNIEELKKQAETEIADFIAQKICPLLAVLLVQKDFLLHRARKNDRA